jgi:hypothetical protein
VPCWPRHCEPPRIALREMFGFEIVKATCATTTGGSTVPEGEPVEAPSPKVIKDNSMGRAAGLRAVGLRGTIAPGVSVLDQLPALITPIGFHASCGGRDSVLQNWHRTRVCQCRL